MPHGRRLDVKATNAIRILNLQVDVWILLKLIGIMDIDINPFI